MNWTLLLSALMSVESGGDTFAHNKKEDARGILQIRAILIRDVNRIYHTSFKHMDAWDEDRSAMIAVMYLRHYEADSFEKAARMWNGGPNGMNKVATESYWEQVEAVLEDMILAKLNRRKGR